MAAIRRLSLPNSLSDDEFTVRPVATPVLAESDFSCVNHTAYWKPTMIEENRSEQPSPYVDSVETLRQLTAPRMEHQSRNGRYREQELHRPFRRTMSSEDTIEELSARLEVVRGSQDVIGLSRRCAFYRYDVPIRGLPAEFDGFCILHLSDIHFDQNSPSRRQEFSRLLKYLDACNQTVDLVCITGDIVTHSGSDLTPEDVRMLAVLGGGCPRVFVMGNHDYYGGKHDLVRTQMSAAGYVELCNDWLEVRRGEKHIGLYGTDDILMGRPKPPIPGDEQLDRVNVVLTHNLDTLTNLYPNIFDLALSGHLHAGEVGFEGVNGAVFMRMSGHWSNRNQQLVGWDGLTDRCISYVSPGQARHFLNVGVMRPGATLLRLRGLSSREPG